MCSLGVFVNMPVGGRLVKEAGMIEVPTAAIVAYTKIVHEYVYTQNIKQLYIQCIYNICTCI